MKLNKKTRQEQEAGKRAVRYAELAEWLVERARLAPVKILWFHEEPVELELKVYVEKKHKKQINIEIGQVMEKLNVTSNGQGNDVRPTRQTRRKARARGTVR